MRLIRIDYRLFNGERSDRLSRRERGSAAKRERKKGKGKEENCVSALIMLAKSRYRANAFLRRRGREGGRGDIRGRTPL
jgi:hypothetical protein